jgi:hypothetical protein
MALQKLDLVQVQKAKDKLIYDKAKEYKLIKEEIQKIKEQYLNELQARELNVKKDIVSMFNGIEERTRRFEDFTMTVTLDSITRNTSYESIVQGLYATYGKTVDGFAETLQKLTDEHTEMVKKSGSASIKPLKALKEGWFTNLIDSIKSIITNLVSKINSILVNKVDSNLDKLESKIQPLKENKKTFKLSDAIKLIESKTGKKVSFQDRPKTLKESLGANTSKFIKDCLEGDLSVTKGQLLIIINEFFDNFETASEFVSFEKKSKLNKTVITSLSKIISKETEINIAKVSKTLDLIMGNLDDVAEFKKIYIEVEKGLLGDYIMDSVPQSQLKGYVAQNATIDLGKAGNNSKGDQDEIKDWLDEMGVENYTINSNGTVDVEGDVDLRDKTLKSIPIQFGKVTGYFTCTNNKLTSLAGAPQTVDGGFYCANNKLTSLAGAPQTVGGGFYCTNNKLTSLAGAPQTVGGGFYCANNNLTSLAGAPQTVGGNFYCAHNNLTSLQGGNSSF